MTTEAFYVFWKDVKLKQSFVDCARHYTNDVGLQEDCLQEAWLAVSQEKDDASYEWVEQIGRRAVDAYRKRWQRPNVPRKERQIRRQRNTRRVHIRIAQSQYNELESAAKECRVTVAEFIRRSVSNGVQHVVPIKERGVM